MASPPFLPEDVWGDFNNALNPLSGAKQPSKAEIRALMRYVVDAIATFEASTGLDPNLIPNLRKEVLQRSARDTGIALAEIGNTHNYAMASTGQPADAGGYTGAAATGTTWGDGGTLFSDGALVEVAAFIGSVGNGQASLVFSLPNGDGTGAVQAVIPITVTATGVVAFKAGSDFPAMAVRAGWTLGWYAPAGGAQIGFKSGGASYSFAGAPAQGGTITYVRGAAVIALGATYAGLNDIPVGNGAVAGLPVPTGTLWANSDPNLRFRAGYLRSITANFATTGNGAGTLVLLSPSGSAFRIEKLIPFAGVAAGLRTFSLGADFGPIRVEDGWALGYYASDGGAQIAFSYGGNNGGLVVGNVTVGQAVTLDPSGVSFSLYGVEAGSFLSVVSRLSAVEASVGALQQAVADVGAQSPDQVATCALSVSGRTVMATGTMRRSGALTPFSSSVTLDAPTAGTVVAEAHTLVQGNQNWAFAPTGNRLANANVSNVLVKDAGSGATLVEGTDYAVGYEHGVVSLYSGTRSTTIGYSYVRRRYDAVLLDPETLTLSVVKGAERIRDAQEFVPADPAPGAGPVPIRLCNARVASSVEVVPNWDVDGGLRRALLPQIQRDQRRGWAALSTVRGLLAAGLPVTVAAQGDSIVAVQSDAPSRSSANGQNRDRATATGTPNTYLSDALSPDAYASLPLYDTGDGAGQVHTRMSLVWTLIAAIQKTAGGAPVSYLNFGVSGSTSTEGNAEPWNGAVLNSGAHLLVLHFGQNELSGSAIEQQTRIKLAAAYAKGMDVLVVSPPRTNGQFGIANSFWLATVRALRRAAEWVDPATGKSAAFLDTTYLYADANLGGLGLSHDDHCAANLFNHPAIREHAAIGSLAARLVVEGLVSVSSPSTVTEYARTHLVPRPGEGLALERPDGSVLARFSNYGMELAGAIRLGDQAQVVPQVGPDGLSVADQLGNVTFHAGYRGAQAAAFEVPGYVRLAPLPGSGLSIADPFGNVVLHSGAQGVQARAFEVPGQFRLTSAPAGLPADRIYVTDPLGAVGGEIRFSQIGEVDRLPVAEVAALDAQAVLASARSHNRTNTATAAMSWDLLHVMVTGQSLGQGYEAFPVETTTGRPEVMMLGPAVRPKDQGGSSGVPLAPGRLQTAVSTAQDLTTGAVLTQDQQQALPPGDLTPGEEVGINSTLFAYELMVSAGLTGGKKFVVSNAAVGGKTIEELSKGGPENLYNRLLDLVSAATAEAVRTGVSYGVIAQYFLQGEWNERDDTGGATDYVTYKSKVIKYHDDFTADACAGIAGQTEVPANILYQTGGEYQNDAYDMAVPMAQLDLCRDGGADGYYMAAPAYPYPNKPSGHMTARGEIHLGLQFGKILFWTCVLRRMWRPTHITRAQVRGRRVLVSCHVPVPPLRWEPMSVGTQPVMLLNKGFSIVDAAGSVPIQSVEIAGKATVDIALGRSIVLPATLYYGRQTEAFGGGNLCDSDPTAPPAWANWVPNLHNWCAMSKTPISTF